MKLRHKIAGTLALPLALAIAGAANAAVVVDNDKHTLKIGGYVAATADWTIYDDAGAAQDSDVNFGMGIGTSRLNIAYTQKTSAGNITYLYENDWAGGGKGDEYRLRHAAIMYDGWVAGYTWSAFSNLTALAETIDYIGPTGISAVAQRTGTLGKNISVGDGMSVGLFVEDRKHALTTGGAATNRTANTPLPDLVANFKGKFGTTSVFAAVEMIQMDKAGSAPAKTEAKVNATFGVSSQVIDPLNLKLAVTSWDEGVKGSPNDRDLGVLVGAQYKITDQIRTNLVVEQFVGGADDTDRTGVWLNGFYKMDAGWEWGAELRSASTDAGKVNGLGDKDMSVSLLAKYAF